MAECFIGEIRIFPYTYAPYGWAECNGQELQVSQNQALFSLLSYNFGGNGTTTFRLPDLQGRLPMHLGNGQGLTPRTLAQKVGAEQFTMTASQMPQHSHTAQATTTLTQSTQAAVTLKGTTESGNANTPENNNLGGGTNFYKSGPRSYVNMAATSVAVTQPAYNANTTVTVGASGSSAPVSFIPPVLVLRFCIALEGIYPTRP
ncbi:MAG TPA: tail fiber protein [bacterium]|nr:tail fiber protein [bacterium]HPN44684.1 tail fiber protein [bacterium]